MHTDVKNFIHYFDHGRKKLCVPVSIPLEISCKEFVGRLIASHGSSIPNYVEQELEEALSEFVAKETNSYFDDDAKEAVDKLANIHNDYGTQVDELVLALQQGHIAYYTPQGVSDEQVFSEAYHSLIHSPALETLLNLEHTYASAVEHTMVKKIDQMQQIAEQQASEMQYSVQAIGKTTTDQDVNHLSATHFEHNQLVASTWQSQLTQLKEEQIREYKNWVMTVHEDFQTSPNSLEYLQRARALSYKHSNPEERDWSPQPTRMEESFTIHLGAQMKSSHNLRLLSADWLDLCKHRPNMIGGVLVPQPQRLQTAMSLYSNHLCAMLLLVDDRLNTFSGIKKDFSEVCEKSTEFHFPDLEHQLETIKLQEPNAHKWKIETQKRKMCDGQTEDNNTQLNEDLPKNKAKLSVGDLYITRHSNLAQVHVIFHMVVDDSLINSNINSRHPVILGLRSLLKVACDKDINTVTIPLLLVHEMTEQMTMQWCMKRAELVFKCVKGFMIEILSWGGNETRTIQFILPKTISEDLFQSIAAMLPSIFRMSNPLVLQAT